MKIGKYRDTQHEKFANNRFTNVVASSKSGGAFHLAKMFCWKFRKLSVSTGKAFLFIRSKLANSLVDQNIYVMAQENSKVEMEVLRKWNDIISVPTVWN